MGYGIRVLTCMALAALPALANAQTWLARLNQAPVGTGSAATASLSVDLDTAARTLSTYAVFNNLGSKSQALAIYSRAKGSLEPVTAALKGFPAGLLAGSSDPVDANRLVDLSTQGAWDSGFWSSSGGTAASAIAALVALVQAGNAVGVITSDDFPGGEIGGTLGTTAMTLRMVRGTSLPPRSLLVPKDGVLRCHPDSDRCFVPVHMGYTGGWCVPRIQFAGIAVPPHSDSSKKIRIVWVLLNAQIGDSTNFRFTPGRGITITANDQTKDFNGPGEEVQDSRRYRWNAVRKQVNVARNFDINVEAYDPASDAWYPCRPVDPTISNVDP